ncbi:RDD family protein [Rhizobium sp. NRK18]|uniref:RDD family protein n=1 Tax=Rhizobium sp. NRK18 TaxID=2964667 RepID=UPI0021C26160|nr:RDD family protein [Rhizobium sp. NRK18]MCQ2004412.1 RDD family protein [Rhizobium sp. NRK18]
MSFDQDFMPPRLAFRRFFAFLVDGMLWGAVASILFYILGFAVPAVHFYNNALIPWGNHCEPANVGEPLTRTIEELWPLAEGETRFHTVCSMNGVLAPPRRILHSGTTRTEDGIVQTRTLSVFIMPNGQPAFPNPLVGAFVTYLPPFLLPVVIGLFTGFSGRTPGKRLMRVKVIENGKYMFDNHPDVTTAIARELVKFWPYLGIIAISFGALFLAASGKPDTVAGLVAAARALAVPVEISLFSIVLAALGLLCLIWWLGPLLFWRGRMWYDSTIGCRVVRR